MADFLLKIIKDFNINDFQGNRIKFLRKYAPVVGFSEHTNAFIDGVKASLGAIYFGAEIVERHFRILEPDKTKDGVASINTRQLKKIISFSKMPNNDQQLYIKKYVPEYESMLGNELRKLSQEELLNRDYYRGRFASKKGDKIIYNWEEL
jgi:N,N'-diacetyllegionaminate synthase